MDKIKLGDEVQDTISGIKGIAIGSTRWISGCDRITIQPKPKKGDVEMPEAITVDEMLVKTLVKKVKKKKKSYTGGFDIKVSSNSKVKKY